MHSGHAYDGSELLGPPGVAPARVLPLLPRCLWHVRQSHRSRGTFFLCRKALRGEANGSSQAKHHTVPLPSVDALPRPVGAGCAPVLVGSAALATIAIRYRYGEAMGSALGAKTLGAPKSPREHKETQLSGQRDPHAKHHVSYPALSLTHANARVSMSWAGLLLVSLGN